MSLLQRLLTIALLSCTSPAPPNSGLGAGKTVAGIDESVWVIFQDSRDNHWFGGDNGAFRYDGKTTVSFTTKDGLPDNRVREIKEDKAGNVYINTPGGICRFDGSTLTTLTVADSKRAVWQLGTEDLWFSAPQEIGGVYRYDGRNLYHLDFPPSPLEADFRRNNPPRPFSQYCVYTIVKDSRGAIWFGTSTFGACRFDGTSHAWLYERDLSLIPGGGSIGIRGILEEVPGRFWISNSRQRFAVAQQDSVADGFHYIRYTKEAGAPPAREAEFDDHTYFQSIVKDETGHIWMQTYSNGIFRYDGKTMIHYPVRKANATVPVITMHQDRNGVIWLGTADDGAYCFSGGRFQKWHPGG